MHKICTDLEQSKELLKLGLSSENADMYWEYDYDSHEHESHPRVLVVRNGYDPYNKKVLAWSFSALLALMPPIANRYPVLQRSNDQNYHYGKQYGKWFMVYVDLNAHGDFMPYRTDFYDTPVDAAYSMIIWLIEQGYIKTEKI